MSSEPQELVDTALAAARADGTVVIVGEHTETNLRWANSTLTTNGVMAARTVTVVSTFARPGGTSAGVLSRSVSSADEIAELVRDAEAAGRDAAPSDDAAPLVERYDNDDDWAAPPARTGVEVFDGLARDLAAQFTSWRAADLLLYGFAEHRMTSWFLGSSTGLRRRFDQPTGRLEVNGKSADLARSAWAGSATRDFTDVDVPATADGLRQRLDWARTRVDLPAGRYDTILPPTAVADLFTYAFGAFDARAADEGRSVFSGATGGTRIGDQLAALPLSLRSDPAYPGLQCPDFELSPTGVWLHQSVFDNGRPITPTAWIDRGRLAHLTGTRAWSAQGRPVTDNLVLDGAPDPVTVEQMVAGVERGLLLTCLWYIRDVDRQTLLYTGLTRDGVYLIEDGRVTGAVNNFRFNESPVDLLGRVTQAGPTQRTLSREWSDYQTRTAMPALRVPDFNMSTVSKAS